MSVNLPYEETSNHSKQQEETEVAGFVFKTFELLEVQDYQKIVYWSTNGLQFVIKDVVKFEEIVLPRYFRHKKMNSFVRQLNMYGFHKMKHNNFKSTFKHEHFQKGRPDLLPLLKRKPKLNQKENQQGLEEVKTAQLIKPQRVLVKQEQATMPNQKWANLSQQFLQTTKMINMSLVKVTINELTDIVNQIPQEEDECLSIEDEMNSNRQGQDLYQFQDPACFFASKFNL